MYHGEDSLFSGWSITILVPFSCMFSKKNYVKFSHVNNCLYKTSAIFIWAIQSSRTFTVFGSSTGLQLNNVFLSHHFNTSLQPPTSQQYFSLTPLQHQPPAPAQRTEWFTLWEENITCIPSYAPLNIEALAHMSYQHISRKFNLLPAISRSDS